MCLTHAEILGMSEWLQNLCAPFSINKVITVVTVNTHTICLLKLVLVTIWMVLFLLSPEDIMSMIYQKQYRNVDPSDRSTLFHLASVHLR